MDYLRSRIDSWFLKIPSLPFLLFPTWLLVYARLDNSVFRAFSLYQSYPSLSEFPLTSFLLLFPALVALHSRKRHVQCATYLPCLLFLPFVNRISAPLSALGSCLIPTCTHLLYSHPFVCVTLWCHSALSNYTSFPYNCRKTMKGHLFHPSLALFGWEEE